MPNGDSTNGTLLDAKTRPDNAKFSLCCCRQYRVTGWFKILTTSLAVLCMQWFVKKTITWTLIYARESKDKDTYSHLKQMKWKYTSQALKHRLSPRSICYNTQVNGHLTQSLKSKWHFEV